MPALDAETRSIVAQTLGRFVDQCYASDIRLARLRTPPVDARLHWPLLTELGVPGLLQPAEAGGMGAGARELSDALQILARGLVLEPAADTLIATSLLAGTQDPHGLLARTAGGERIPIVVGLASPPGALRVERGADGTPHLRGYAAVVPFAADADDWLVIARSDAGTPCVLVLNADNPGVRIERFALMDGRPAADLHFDLVLSAAAFPFLDRPDIEPAVEHTSDLWLAACAADAVGVMEHVIGLTREYLRTRVQFGVAIGSFQALQHRLADMQMAYLEARALLRSWTAALDDAADAKALPRMRRALPRVVSRAGQQVGQEAIQMHGGMGVTDELVVSHCNARLQVDASLLQAWANAKTAQEVL